ncbi:hypothetical protein [Haloplanus rubicundus]|uniref:hypothetical protein n=1 Tax=Haloplanus rubicundus TaxID=1547898 RepID=UPI001300B541|nr:hypothetical protein [Haloplanus rubicundus]
MSKAMGDRSSAASSTDMGAQNVSTESTEPIDLYDDTVVLTEDIGSRNVDDEGHVLQEPELVRRMVTEVESY